MTKLEVTLSVSLNEIRMCISLDVFHNYLHPFCLQKGYDVPNAGYNGVNQVIRNRLSDIHCLRHYPKNKITYIMNGKCHTPQGVELILHQHYMAQVPSLIDALYNIKQTAQVCFFMLPFILFMPCIKLNNAHICFHPNCIQALFFSSCSFSSSFTIFMFFVQGVEAKHEVLVMHVITSSRRFFLFFLIFFPFIL